MVDGDLTALVKEGESDDVSLHAHWVIINQQYVDLAGDTLNKAAISLELEVEALAHRITSIYEALEILRTYRVDELVELLQKEGYRFQFNSDDLVSYYKDLSRVSTRAKTLIVELETKTAQLARQHDSKGGEKIARDHFESWLVVLSKFMGHNLNPDELTVARYATIMKHYNSHCELVI